MLQPQAVSDARKAIAHLSNALPCALFARDNAGDPEIQQDLLVPVCNSIMAALDGLREMVSGTFVRSDDEMES